MKKFFALLLALTMLCACAAAETVNQVDEQVLNIFTWEGYIDYETVIKPFEEETGIKVNYATFAGIYADEAYSGTKDDRPRFVQLIQDCKDGKIDRIMQLTMHSMTANGSIWMLSVRKSIAWIF